MSLPQGCLRASASSARPSAEPRSTSPTTRSVSPCGEHLDGLVHAARRLHHEALLDHAQLEHRRLLRIDVDEQRLLPVGQQAGLQVLAGDRVVEEVEQVRVEDRALVLGERRRGLLRREGLAEGVARVLGEVGVGVADGEHARAERDVLAAAAVRGSPGRRSARTCCRPPRWSRPPGPPARAGARGRRSTSAPPPCARRTARS